MKKRAAYLIWMIFGLGLGQVWAQTDYPYTVQNYPFLNKEASVLHFPGALDDYVRLYQRMEDLMLKGSGQINIVHIGGSHVQADMWTDRLRQRFQTAFDGVRGSRGLVFPYRMAGSNNPPNYIVDYTGKWESCKNVQAKRVCTLGLLGYVVTTTDTLTTIGFRFREPLSPAYDFSSISVFHDQDSTAYRVRLLSEAGADSGEVDLKHGRTRFNFGSHRQTFTLEIRKTDSIQNHFSLYGISLENADPGFIYHAVGVNGASTGSYRRCSLFTQHLSAIKPDLVIFSVGINDANTLDFDAKMYERNYDTLVSWVKAANPAAAVLFTTNTDSYYKKKYPNKNATKVRDVMMRLAKRHGAAVWDAFAVMGGLGSIKHWIKAGLANTDKVHLVKPGYELLADLLFQAIMQDYDQFLQKKHLSRN